MARRRATGAQPERSAAPPAARRGAPWAAGTKQPPEASVWHNAAEARLGATSAAEGRLSEGRLWREDTERTRPAPAPGSEDRVLGQGGCYAGH
eukprot:1814685-Alexandrium_andersonii.AAC.1